MRWLILACAMISTVSIAQDVIIIPPSGLSPPEETTAPKPLDPNIVSKNDCIQRLLAAEKIGIVRGFLMDGSVPTLIVDEDIWNKATYDLKTGIAETANCALLGPHGYVAKLYIRSHITNRIIGEWSVSLFGGRKLEVK